MFVDACALVAILSDEPEADRISSALATGATRFTSPVVILETVLALARPDKFGVSVEAAGSLVIEFLAESGIEIRDLHPAGSLTTLALSAAHRYRHGRQGLNLGDCLHYACAKHYQPPILATADEFRQTDCATVL